MLAEQLDDGIKKLEAKKEKKTKKEKSPLQSL
jgi:hypothetical protein